MLKNKKKMREIQQQRSNERTNEKSCEVKELLNRNNYTQTHRDHKRNMKQCLSIYFSLLFIFLDCVP